MRRYILDTEDEICVLPPQDDDGAVIELFSQQRMMFFAVSAVGSGCMMKNTIVDRAVCDALCFTAADQLLGRVYEIFVPTNRADFAKFLEDFKRYAPERLDFSREGIFAPNSCDQTGTHHRH
ncbi:MAG: hypothetical protein IIY04_00035 [Oscillospiraceae bacterium]|nr:hypothetical protein [Oscillospiraceae bacterium]